MVASPAANHIQVDSSDVQSSLHVHSGLPTPSDRRTSLQPNFTFICHLAAGPTVHRDRLFQACFPVFSTVCSLKLADTDFLSVFKSRLNTFSFDYLPSALLKLRPYGAIEIRLLLLILLLMKIIKVWSQTLIRVVG